MSELCTELYTSICNTGKAWLVLGNWFFPNGTRVFSRDSSTDFYRDRDEMVVDYV